LKLGPAEPAAFVGRGGVDEDAIHVEENAAGVEGCGCGRGVAHACHCVILEAQFAGTPLGLDQASAN
jgi:hypothetical protein